MQSFNPIRNPKRDYVIEKGEILNGTTLSVKWPKMIINEKYKRYKVTMDKENKLILYKDEEG